MRARLEHHRNAVEVVVVRRQWLLARAGLPLFAAMLISLTGCAGAGEQQALAEDSDPEQASQIASADPMREALRKGATATPEEFGGFCVEGAGVFLSAVGDTAELTLYVVA